MGTMIMTLKGQIFRPGQDTERGAIDEDES